MQIKKRTLYIAIPIFIIIVLALGIGYHFYEKEQEEKRADTELKESYERALETEYNYLLVRYENTVETIKDYTLPDEVRFKAVMDLNDLLGIQQYENTRWAYSTIDKCLEKLAINEEYDKQLLRQKASNTVYSRFMGITE